MELLVECNVGDLGEETPRTFYLGARRISVAEVLDRWFGPDHRYFKIRGEGGGIYILRYDVFFDRWELTFFKAEGEGSLPNWIPTGGS